MTDTESWARTLIHFFQQGLERDDLIDKGYPKNWVEKAYQLYLEDNFVKDPDPPYEYLEID